MTHIEISYSPENVRSEVIVGHDDLYSVQGHLLRTLSSFKHLFVFIDRNLMMRSRVIYDLSLELQDMGCPMRTVDASESLKTMDNVLGMCSWLMDKGADRDAVLVAIGGGITTDMVGFAASIYKRGVRYISVPTTLLSQIDAAIGGKTGVNFEHYKNMLGVISQPIFTFIWPEFLKTLPRRDFLSGAAELLKTFIIEDESEEWYGRSVTLLEDYCADSEILERSSKELSDIIEAAAKVKAGVVSRDPHEKGERRKLNLGHTFAHAIETLSRQDIAANGMPVLDVRNNRKSVTDITHGEAVAIGIVMAARLAEKIAAASVELNVEKGLAERIERDFLACGLPVESPFRIEDMIDAMSKDKKAEDGKVHFILPLAIGEVVDYEMTLSQACALLKK